MSKSIYGMCLDLQHTDIVNKELERFTCKHSDLQNFYIHVSVWNKYYLSHINNTKLASSSTTTTTEHQNMSTNTTNRLLTILLTKDRLSHFFCMQTLLIFRYTWVVLQIYVIEFYCDFYRKRAEWLTSLGRSSCCPNKLKC